MQATRFYFVKAGRQSAQNQTNQSERRTRGERGEKMARSERNIDIMRFDVFVARNVEKSRRSVGFA